MSEPTLFELMESPCEWTDYSCESIVHMAADEIERLEAENEWLRDDIIELEAVKEAAQEALECLYFHSFEPGEDPRISNLAGALLIADGTLGDKDNG